MNYVDRLRQSAEQSRSIACMGLDPVIEGMPEEFQKQGISGVPEFYEQIFIEMKKQKVYPGAFKPNQGYYIKHDNPMGPDFSGSKALDKVIDLIQDNFPDIPVILDFKRGDITTSSKNYAVEGFEGWCADAVTISPFMGSDSVAPFLEYCNDEQGRGVYILNRTSNKGAHDLQDLLAITPDEFTNLANRIVHLHYHSLHMKVPEIKEEIKNFAVPLYLRVAKKITEWAHENPGVGAVVGATSPKELENLVAFYAGKDIPLLIPGVGGQGGSAADVSRILQNAKYDRRIARINSSSGLTHPWTAKKEKAPSDFAMVCTEALHKLNEEIGYNA